MTHAKLANVELPKCKTAMAEELNTGITADQFIYKRFNNAHAITGRPGR